MSIKAVHFERNPLILHRSAGKIVVFITDYTFLTCSREEGKIFELEKRARTLNKSNAKTRLVD